MARGGRRAGAPATPYSNRTDLTVTNTAGSPSTSPHPQPVYGQGTADAQARAALPVPHTVTAQPAPTSSGQAAPSAPNVLAGTLPHDLPPIDQPGSGPITAGLSSGAGPGPEALVAPTTAQRNQMAAKWLPFFDHVVKTDPTVPQEILDLVRYLRSTT